MPGSLGSAPSGRPREPGWQCAGLIALAALFMVFTFAPPRVELFRDPPTGTYGAR